MELAQSKNPWNLLEQDYPQLKKRKHPPALLDTYESRHTAKDLATQYSQLMTTESKLLLQTIFERKDLEDAMIDTNVTPKTTIDQYFLPEQQPPRVAITDELRIESWEITTALEASNHNSSPGLDGITYLHMLNSLETKTFWSIFDWLSITGLMKVSQNDLKEL